MKNRIPNCIRIFIWDVVGEILKLHLPVYHIFLPRVKLNFCNFFYSKLAWNLLITYLMALCQVNFS